LLALGMEEPGLMRLTGLGVLEVEDARVEAAQLVARGASEPARERRDGDTDPGGGAGRVLVEALLPGGGHELLDALADALLDGGEQPRLGDGHRLGQPLMAPVVHALDQDREVRQVDQGSDAAGEHQVARADAADAAEVARLLCHRASPAVGAPAGTPGSSSVDCPSSSPSGVTSSASAGGPNDHSGLW